MKPGDYDPWKRVTILWDRGQTTRHMVRRSEIPGYLANLPIGDIVTFSFTDPEEEGTVTTRYEGAGAKDTRITIVEAGEQIGDDVVPEGQIALCFNYDEVFYIQGRSWDVGQLLQDGLDLLVKRRRDQIEKEE